jgi:hypothetical protein
MGASAIAIAIKVATTPAARFTVYPSAFRPAPFSPLAGLGLFSPLCITEAATVAIMFLGNYS